MTETTITKRDGLTLASNTNGIPISEMVGILDDAGAGMVVDAQLARALSVQLVVGSKVDCTREHDRLGLTRQPPSELVGMKTQERVEAWLARGDVGISSETIALFMIGRPFNRNSPLPRDADDFERCSLLLKWAPRLQERLGELHSLAPEWGRLADNWSRLEELLAAGKEFRPQIYALLLSLNVEE